MFEAVKNRRPWVAALITFFLTPAVGMAYLNRGKLALGYLGILIFLQMAAVFFLPHSYPPPRLVSWFQIANLAVTVSAVIQVIGIAKHRDPAEPLKSYSRLWYCLAGVYLGIVAILFGVRFFFYRPFDIPAASMEPTVNPGDFVLVSEQAYRAASPERGDVIVFHATQFRADFIKRIVGLPGDRVQMAHGRLVLNGVAVPTRRIAAFDHVPTYEEIYPGGKIGRVLDRVSNGPEDDTEVFTVPANSYFVLGDNRDNSNDSRESIGLVPRDTIIGKAVIKYIADGHWVWQPIN
ncbi:MAG TPA: signal peptidase I [Rhizomicrobium sp.]|nr:signal peptidase I [Rhizomicrobium sp.]